MKTATSIPGAHLGRTPEGGKGKHNHFVLFLHYLGKCIGLSLGVELVWVMEEV